MPDKMRGFQVLLFVVFHYLHNSFRFVFGQRACRYLFRMQAAVLAVLFRRFAQQRQQLKLPMI